MIRARRTLLTAAGEVFASLDLAMAGISRCARNGVNAWLRLPAGSDSVRSACEVSINAKPEDRGQLIPVRNDRGRRRQACMSTWRQPCLRSAFRSKVERDGQSIGARGLYKADHRRAQKRRSDLSRCPYRLVSDVSHEAGQPQPAVQAIGDIGVLHIIGRL